ncbi:MAG: hypothetical protein QXO21_03670 [Candidatus Anstonellales archaeon]
MKKIFLFLFFSFTFSLIKAQEKTTRDWLHLSNHLEIYSNSISGSGTGLSSLTPGTHFSNLLTLNGTGGGYSYNLGFKATDDKTRDIKRYTLTNMEFKLSKGAFVLNCGDTYESFTQYTNNSLLKGVSLKYANPTDNSTEIILLYGLDLPRWDYLSNEQGFTLTKRNVYGIRAKHNFRNGLSLGINGVNTIDNNYVEISTNTIEPLYKNTVYSIDLEYIPFEGFTFKLETAKAFTQESVESSTTTDHSGTALILKAIGDTLIGRITIEYENVSPDFLTLVGSSIRDREKIKFFWKLNKGKNFSIFFNCLHYRNNLDGARETTNNFKPEIGCSLVKLFKRQYSSIDLKIQMDRQSSVNIEAMSNAVTINYRDRFPGSIDNETALSISNYETRANIRNSAEYNVTTSFKKRYSMKTYSLRPLLEFSLWTRNDKINSTTDNRVGYGTGIEVDIPSYKIKSNVKINQNSFTPQVGDTITNTTLNIHLNYRLITKIFNYGLVFVKFISNNYKSSNVTNSFREYTVSTGLNLEF